MAKNNIIYSLRWINSRVLIIPCDYQRPEDNPRVAAIAANFDERVANEPKVSLRNGRYYVFDGQHTVLARKVLNGGNDLLILCKVYERLSEEEEAYLFAMQTGKATFPTPGQRMKALLYAKDEEIIAFKKATESAGILIDLNGSLSDEHMRCINTALYEYRHIGEPLYIEALSLIREAWNAEKASLKNEIIKGICRFVKLYHGEYNHSRLIKCLSDVSPCDVSDMMKLDIKNPPIKRVIKPFFDLYNGVSSIGALPKRF